MIAIDKFIQIVRLCGDSIGISIRDVYKRQRPLVDNEIIVRSMHTVEKEKACVAGMPVKDTIKVSDELGYSANTLVPFVSFPLKPITIRFFYRYFCCLLYTSRCV